MPDTPYGRHLPARNWGPRLSRLLISSCGLGLLAIYGLAWIIHPLVIAEKGPVLCVYRQLTGRLCPLCGMTRAFASVMHGDIKAAFGYNLLWWIPFTLLALLGVLCLVDGLFGTNILNRKGHLMNAPGWALLAIFLLYGVYRAL